jgi:AcrR family transcriptional regulator
MPEPGLRERKKAQNRQAILDAALGLFAERGFERMTVAEIAVAAGVSEATVFNYFPTKEDLVYSRMEAFEERLLAAVRDRSPDQTPLAAFRAALLAPEGLLGPVDPDSVRQLRTIAGIIAGSPALRARERQVYEDATDALARVLTRSSRAGHDDIEPWVVANALIGVHRALVSHTRAKLLAGADSAALRRFIRTHAERALTLLQHGIGDESHSAVRCKGS